MRENDSKMQTKSIFQQTAKPEYRDCPVAPYLYENRIWLSVRAHYHLRQGKMMRAAVLEAIGLVLLAGIYFDVRYVFPRRSRSASSRPEDKNPQDREKRPSQSAPGPCSRLTLLEWRRLARS